MAVFYWLFFFFFQAEDGIRDIGVTGVQTCALPISSCGGTSMLGAHHLYADAPALVLRCPTCSGMVLRVGSRDGRLLLDMSGSSLLEIPVPGSSVRGAATGNV